MRTPRRWFEGKVVAISGGAGGLGTAMGRLFLREGAKVALLDLDGAAAESTAAELIHNPSPGDDPDASDGRGPPAPEAVGFACDVTSPQACAETMAAIVDRWGGIDILVCNAGLTQRSAFASTSVEVYRKVMDVNFFGSLHCTKAALESLIARTGSVVVISSVAGFAPLYGRTGYAASKHALHGLFGSLRGELAAHGVGVSIVCPSFVDTGFSQSALDGDGSTTQHPQSTVGGTATPEEVARAVLQAAHRRRPLTVLSPTGRLAWWISRVAPSLYERMMIRSLRSELERV